MDERRADPRFACDVQARISTPDGVSAEGRTIDISASGICMLSADPVPPGSHATFSLQLVFEHATSDSLVLPGRVVWCTPLNEGYQVGATFSSTLDAGSVRKLDNLLAVLSGEVEPGADLS